MNRRDIFILSACILFLFFLYFSNSYEYFRSSNPIPTLEDLKDIVGSNSLSHWKLKTPNTNIQKLLDYFKNLKWDPSVSPEDKQGLMLLAGSILGRHVLDKNFPKNRGGLGIDLKEIVDKYSTKPTEEQFIKDILQNDPGLLDIMLNSTNSGRDLPLGPNQTLQQVRTITSHIYDYIFGKDAPKNSNDIFTCHDEIKSVPGGINETKCFKSQPM